MVATNKTVAFRGFRKKEESLLQSFLNLLSGELPFDLMEPAGRPVDLSIVDENALDSDNIEARADRTLVIGSPESGHGLLAVPRPVRWERFRDALFELLALSGADLGPGRASAAGKLATADIESWTVSIEHTLDSARQVLGRFRDGQEAHSKEQSPRRAESRPAGAEIQFWSRDCEVLLDDETVFQIDVAGERVYSELPVDHWTGILAQEALRTRDLAPEWRLERRATAYPLVWLSWCCAQARSHDQLLPEIDPKQLFQLRAWPNFELLRNDNDSVILCALAFSRPESLRTLVDEWEMSREVTIPFMNACHLLGLLRKRTGEQAGAVPSLPDRDSTRKEGLPGMWGT